MHEAGWVLKLLWFLLALLPWLHVKADTQDISIGDLTEVVAEQQRMLQSLQSLVIQQQSTINKLVANSSRVTDLTRQLGDVENDVSSIKETITQLRTESEGRTNQSAAFLAVMPGYPECINNILQFETVRLNSGDCFDSSTGVFTAVVGGTYYFSAHLVSDNSGEYENFHIRRNGLEQCRLLVEGVSGDDVYVTTTCGVTLVLAPGDQVYVACSGTTALNAGDINGFTGFRV